jgi:hypothetical protein
VSNSASRFAARVHREQKRLAIIGIFVGAICAVLGIGATFMTSSAAPPQPTATATATPLPAIADQWLSVQKTLAKQGWSIRSRRREVLRDDGRESTILTLRPKDPESARTRSDQVRIFDVTNGRLVQTFTFEPSERGDCQTAFNFRVLGVGRFEDDEDTRDLIATFSTNDDGPQGIQIPVVISWDPVTAKFVIRGLLRSGADLVEVTLSDGPFRGTDKSWFEDAVELFTKPYALAPDVQAWGASNVKFQERGGTWAPLFVGVYRLNAGNPSPIGDASFDVSTPVVYERAIWSLYTNNQGRLLAGNCTLPRDELVTTEEKTTDQLLRLLANEASDIAESCDVNPNEP